VVNADCRRGRLNERSKPISKLEAGTSEMIREKEKKRKEKKEGEDDQTIKLTNEED